MTPQRLATVLFYLCAISSTRAFAPLQTPLSTKAAGTPSSTAQAMSKNSDRAHIERNLEDMMNNDWRVFRAHLVAQEQAEQAEGRSKKNSSEHSNLTADTDSKNLQKQSQLSQLFDSAVNSIFKNKTTTAAATRENIFKGDSVGGLPVGDQDDMVFCNDPFVSAGELPLLLKPLVPKIDKHRWAHEIPHVEVGSVLIANEKLGGVFHQSILLIIEHSKNAGSIGVVINRYEILLVLYDLSNDFIESSCNSSHTLSFIHR